MLLGLVLKQASKAYRREPVNGVRKFNTNHLLFLAVVQLGKVCPARYVGCTSCRQVRCEHEYYCHIITLFASRAIILVHVHYARNIGLTCEESCGQRACKFCTARYLPPLLPFPTTFKLPIYLFIPIVYPLGKEKSAQRGTCYHTDTA